VRSAFAYILFYMRKDLPRLPLEKIYPSVQSFQRGSPVRLRREYGQKWYGWVAKEREDGIIEVKVDRMHWFVVKDMIEIENDVIEGNKKIK
jgi:hypothetical protein